MADVNPRGDDGRRLKRYWATGPGRAKWIGSPTPYRTLRALLSRYVGPNVLDGLTANIFKLATGHYPSQRSDGQRL